MAPPSALRHRLVLVIALAGLPITMAVALAIGPVNIPVHTVVEVILRRSHVGDFDVRLVDDQIVWQLRMPRILGAAAVGAGLACCGAVLQSLTRNDLADPYLLGISSGAAVGAVTVIVLGASAVGLAGNTAITVAAFIGALVSLIVVLTLAASRGGVLAPARTVLAGVAVAEICSAYTSLLVIMQGDGDAARRVLTWTLGSAAGFRWSSAVTVSIAALICVVLFSAYASALDAFAFGESSARSLGVAVDRVRWTLMIGTALLTACLVAYAGAIGFVGLVIPHVVRMLVGAQHRILLPASALVGASFLVWSDTLARSLVNEQEIPIGVVTALIGAPFFVWLLRRTQDSAT